MTIAVILALLASSTQAEETVAPPCADPACQRIVEQGRASRICSGSANSALRARSFCDVGKVIPDPWAIQDVRRSSTPGSEACSRFLQAVSMDLAAKAIRKPGLSRDARAEIASAASAASMALDSACALSRVTSGSGMKIDEISEILGNLERAGNASDQYCEAMMPNRCARIGGTGTNASCRVENLEIDAGCLRPAIKSAEFPELATLLGTRKLCSAKALCPQGLVAALRAIPEDCAKIAQPEPLPRATQSLADNRPKYPPYHKTNCESQVVQAGSESYRAATEFDESRGTCVFRPGVIGFDSTNRVELQPNCLTNVSKTRRLLEAIAEATMDCLRTGKGRFGYQAIYCADGIDAVSGGDGTYHFNWNGGTFNDQFYRCEKDPAPIR